MPHALLYWRGCCSALRHVAATLAFLLFQSAVMCSDEIAQGSNSTISADFFAGDDVHPMVFPPQAGGTASADNNVTEAMIQWKRSEIVLGLKIVLLCAVLLVLVGGLVLFTRRRRQRERQTSMIMEDSLGCISEFSHPMYLISADQFLSLTMEELSVLHEGFRSRLLTVDTMSCYHHFRLQGNNIVFFSYQWLSFQEKGPNASQLGSMVAGLGQLMHRKRWQADQTYVWLDILSIPQRNDTMKRLAVTALHMYAKYANAFLIICPSSRHTSTGAAADLESYQSRVWTRAEMLSHAIGKGVSSMYVVREQGSLDRMNPAMLRTSAMIFEGEMSCCRNGHNNGTTPCDRQSLVKPLLALYYEALVLLEDGEEDARMRLMEQNLGHCKRETFDPVFFARILTSNLKDKIFPRHFMYAKGTSGISEKQELFGDLIKRVDARFGDGQDGKLRLNLQKERLRAFTDLRFTNRTVFVKKSPKSVFFHSHTEPSLGPLSVNATKILKKAWTSLPRISVSPNPVNTNRAKE